MLLQDAKVSGGVISQTERRSITQDLSTYRRQMLKMNLRALPTSTPSVQMTGLTPRVELLEFHKLRGTQIQKRLY